MRKNKVPYLLLALFATSLSAQDSFLSGKKSSMSIRAIDLRIDSATAKNALSMGNGLFLNNRLSGVNDITFAPSMQFKGQGIEWETNIRHTRLFKSNYLLSYAALTSGEAPVPNTYDSTITFGGSPIVTHSDTAFIYSNNKLSTARISYSGDFYIFNQTKNPLLENLALRVGFESTGNFVKMISNRNIENGYDSFSGPTSGIDFMTKKSIEYSESYGNALLGFNYSMTFLNKNKIDFGFEYFKSFASSAAYLEKTLSIFSVGGLVLPSTGKIDGMVKTEASGARYAFGYSYLLGESAYIRFSYMMSQAVHTVTSADIKSPPGVSLFLSGDTTTALFLLTQSGLGPYPSSKDVRSQIGIEFGYKY
ncbi:hypothetical protein CH373_03345 [Leptospira perolatii]|uniref:Porin n=1 Tax=Leptospira perolatii TaxID=2023191 RepID=A0A2M9ZSS7_9LEPT|nr:hypothetical protein [Leptospira perolatii]PJZ71533.1 hypothetical protein CH360_03340 [Leptospira perolatii]PJZ75065.1 hypothetical protein CH373_03345 [Leptospira perolatii]